MNKQQLVDIVCEAIKETNGQNTVVHKGLTIDNMCNISRDDMDDIEEEHNIVFVQHGKCILIKRVSIRVD